jgi:hypothetical protein
MKRARLQASQTSSWYLKRSDLQDELEKDSILVLEVA